MAFDGSGGFSRPVADYVYDTVISETDVNTEMDGIATGLSTCITKNGQTTVTANLPMAGYRHTGVGNGSARNHYAAIGQVQDSSFIWCGTAGGTANALTLTPTPAITAYATGQRFIFQAGAAASDSTVTIAVSGLASPKAAQFNDAALSASIVIEADKYYEAIYDGTAFQLTRLSSVPFADPMTTRGDVIVRNASNVTARLAVGAADTALMSNGTDAAWAGVVKQGTHTIAIPAAAMIPTTTNGCAALAQVEGSNSHYSVLDFDASSDEHAFFTVPMPKSWNEGTVTFLVDWTSTAADTDGVAWALQGVATSDGDALDVAYGTAVVVTDAAQSTSGDHYQTAVSGAVTIAGTPAALDLVRFRVFRDVSDAADTMAEDARLLVVRIFYTVNAGDDA